MRECVCVCVYYEVIRSHWSAHPVGRMPNRFVFVYRHSVCSSVPCYPPEGGIFREQETLHARRVGGIMYVYDSLSV